MFSTDFKTRTQDYLMLIIIFTNCVINHFIQRMHKHAFDCPNE